MATPGIPGFDSLPGPLQEVVLRYTPEHIVPLSEASKKVKDLVDNNEFWRRFAESNNINIPKDTTSKAAVITHYDKAVKILREIMLGESLPKEIQDNPIQNYVVLQNYIKEHQGRISYAFNHLFEAFKAYSSSYKYVPKEVIEAFIVSGVKPRPNSLVCLIGFDPEETIKIFNLYKEQWTKSELAEFAWTLFYRLNSPWGGDNTEKTKAIECVFVQELARLGVVFNKVHLEGKSASSDINPLKEAIGARRADLDSLVLAHGGVIDDSIIELVEREGTDQIKQLIHR